MYRTTEACEFKDDIFSMPKIESANSPLKCSSSQSLQSNGMSDFCGVILH